LFALAASLAIAANCAAEAPTITYLFPSAVAPGKTNEVTVFGSGLSGARTLWTSFAAKVEKLQAADDHAVFKVIVPANRATGFGAVRLVATNGISSLQFIMLDSLPSMLAQGTNHSPTIAQLLKPPVAIEGICHETAAEFFKIDARKGQRLSFDVAAQRLGSSMDPLMRLFDSAGRELVFCEDTPGAGVDGRFTCKFPASGPYTLELRDTRYEAGARYRYRLRVGDFALDPLPLPFYTTPAFAQPASPLPQINETEPNDSTPQKVTIPAAIRGRFAKAKDRDCFQFEAKKSERLVFLSQTRSLGSPCDAYLRLETLDGKRLAESPLTGAEESSLTNTFKEPGGYRLIVEEAAQAGGPEFFYRLEIKPFQAGFNLSVDTDKVQGPVGGTAEIKITPERHGYDGPIQLSVEPTDLGLALEPNEISGKTNSTTLKLRLPATLQPAELVHLRITGRAQIDGRDFTAIASTRPALRKLFPHIPWPPPELDGWIGLAATPK
jgi:hypothetical protein